MMKTDHSSENRWTPARIQFCCLAAVSSVAFLFTILGVYKEIAYYYAENFLVIPAALFVGVSLTGELKAEGRRCMKLAAFMCLWYIIVASKHRLQGMAPTSASAFFCMYLLVFPFAAVTGDGERQEGLLMAAKVFAASALVNVGYGLLAVADRVPAFLESLIKFDGGRLMVLFHPNITACVYMIGAVFCIGGIYRTEIRWKKGMLLAAASMQFIMIALTNSRTTLLIGCVFLGGMVFFTILRGGFWLAVKTAGGWKRILAAVVAAILVIAGVFVVSGEIYDANYERLVKMYIAEQAAAEPVQTAAAVTTSVQTEVADIKLPTVNRQGSLSNDMKTLNGRTRIWTAAFKAIKDDPALLLWGTAYVDTAITENFGGPYIEHSHNSWIEVLMKMGIPGLAVALALTWIGVKKSLYMLFFSRDMWKICMALLTLCLMVTGFLEVYFFNGKINYHMIEYIFLLLVGYLSQWKEENKI